MTILCGQPTKTGEPCRIPLKGGKCPTHSLSMAQLSKRNRKSQIIAMQNDPFGYHAQRVKAGQVGFASLAKKVGSRQVAIELILENGANYRLSNPTKAEHVCMAWLSELGIKFVREANVAENYSVDFLLPTNKIIEVDGYRLDAPFGDKGQSDLDSKVKCLESMGFKVITLHLCQKNTNEDHEYQKLLDFLHLKQAK